MVNSILSNINSILEFDISHMYTDMYCLMAPNPMIADIKEFVNPHIDALDNKYLAKTKIRNNPNRFYEFLHLSIYKNLRIGDKNNTLNVIRETYMEYPFDNIIMEPESINYYPKNDIVNICMNFNENTTNNIIKARNIMIEKQNEMLKRIELEGTPEEKSKIRKFNNKNADKFVDSHMLLFKTKPNFIDEYFNKMDLNFFSGKSYKPTYGMLCIDNIRVKTNF